MSAETIVDRLQHHAKARPDAPAIVSLDRTVSYRELHALAGGCAEWLRSLGVEPGERVGVSIADDRAHLVVALGLASLGAAHATLATHDPAASRSRLAERVGVRRVVALHDGDSLPGLDLVKLDPERLASWARRTPSLLARPDASSLFTFVTTSGTTGEAKIISIAHGRLAQQFARAWSGCRLTLTSPEYHFAKRGFLYAVLGGSAIAIRGSSDLPAARLCTLLGADTIVCMAAHGRALVAEAARTGRLPPGTVVQFSGSRSSAPMRRELLEQVCDAVAVTYSMQECGSIARTIERSVDDVSESVGRPHPGIQVEIVDETGTPLPRGEIGEIRIRAPGMATGYLDDERANAAHFRDGWFHPRDLASFSPDGSLVIHGRADDVMNLNGIKIARVEIERALERHPAVKAVAAFSLRSGHHGEIPAAAVVLAEGSRADERELQKFARDVLGLRSPRRVIIVEGLPATQQGKVDLRRLAEMLSGGARP
jgi:acyl-coenzyme A synthetase/AMP-(fatty) acid ligase